MQSTTAAGVPPLRGIMARAAAHVERFTQEFALVISDEQYRQQVAVPAYSRQRRGAVRSTRAEMLFLWVPETRTWMTARNVLWMDGTPQRDSDGVIDRILANADERVLRARRLRAASARFNLGSVYRNFNDPTFTLQFLGHDLSGHFRWTLRDREKVEGAQTFRIDFEERMQPTVIARDDVSLASNGSVWIDGFTGVVYKTHLDVQDEEVHTQGQVDVMFARDPRLGLVVPVRMDERYSQDRKIPLGNDQTRWVSGEVIQARARYSNFRRFETSGRLVTPQ
jgi:hypothetical protein